MKVTVIDSGFYEKSDGSSVFLECGMTAVVARNALIYEKSMIYVDGVGNVLMSPDNYVQYVSV